MRVTLVRQYFATRDQAGSTRGFEFARRLVESGHNVTVITSDPSRSAGASTHRVEAGVKVIAIPNAYHQSMSYRRRLRSFMRFALKSALVAIRQPTDVVLASSTPLSVAIPGLAASRIRRVPFVFEVRDLWPEMPIAVGALRGKMPTGLARILEWLAYHGSSAVIALSPGMAKGVEARGIPLSRIAIIPNSSDLDLWPEFHQRRAVTYGEIGSIVYAGSLGKVNGLDYLVDLGAALRTLGVPVRIQVVGQGSEAERIQAAAKARGLAGESIEFLGPRPKSEMPEILREATLGISLFLPIKAMEANSANKFFDYLAAGLPVAINYGGWQAEIVKAKKLGLVLPLDADVAAGQIARFLQDDHSVAEASIAAREVAKDHFSRDAHAAQLLSLLTAVVARDARAIEAAVADSRNYLGMEVH